VYEDLVCVTLYVALVFKIQLPSVSWILEDSPVWILSWFISLCDNLYELSQLLNLIKGERIRTLALSLCVLGSIIILTNFTFYISIDREGVWEMFVPLFHPWRVPVFGITLFSRMVHFVAEQALFFVISSFSSSLTLSFTISLLLFIFLLNIIEYSLPFRLR